MLTSLHRIAEQKISEAIANGSMADLSHWKGRPLPEDDMANVPQDLRLAYRMLKSAGYIPEELTLHKEIKQTEDLLRTATGERERYKLLKKINLMKSKLEAKRGRPFHFGEGSDYFNRVVDKLAGKGGSV